MEGRYKSLAAMDASPWIAHFTKTAGDTQVLSSRPRPIVVEKKYMSHGKGQQTSKDADNMPLTIVSPVGQSTEMAQADLNMEWDKNKNQTVPPSLGGPTAIRSQPTALTTATTSRKQRGRKRALHTNSQSTIQHHKKTRPASTSVAASTAKGARSINTKAVSRIRDIFTGNGGR